MQIMIPRSKFVVDVKCEVGVILACGSAIRHHDPRTLLHSLEFGSKTRPGIFARAGSSPLLQRSVPESAMDKNEARAFLTSLLNKNLRIITTDGRLFWGQFKCTDPVRPRPSLPPLLPRPDPTHPNPNIPTCDGLLRRSLADYPRRLLGP